MTYFNPGEGSPNSFLSLPTSQELHHNAPNAGPSKKALHLEKKPIDVVQSGQSSSAKSLHGRVTIAKNSQRALAVPTPLASQRAVDAPNSSVHPLQLKNSQTFLGKYTQISVLNQMFDNTPHGIENCGFHALKNSLAMLVCLNGGKEVEALFNDPAIFLSFYNRYCMPLLANRENSDPKDASIPMLRDIIRNIQNDPNPPQELAFVKQIFRKQDTNLVILSTSTSSDGALKGFIGNEGIVDAKIVYQFAKEPGPKDLVLLFGNQDEGHWITVAVNKDENGNLHYFGCDSMDNDHQMLGDLSQFAKIAKAIESGIMHLDETMLAAFADPCEDLSRQVGWIGTDSERLLLDDAPNPLMTKEKGSTGSNHERVLNQSMLIFQTIIDIGWLESPEMEIQIVLSNIQSLMAFFSNKLEPGPVADKCKEIVATIKHNRGESYFKGNFSISHDNDGCLRKLRQPSLS